VSRGGGFKFLLSRGGGLKKILILSVFFSRLLLGTNSYELYTLEKVVEKIMGQVQSVTHDSRSVYVCICN
jgi:hypothetical protein